MEIKVRQNMYGTKVIFLGGVLKVDIQGKMSERQKRFQHIKSILKNNPKIESQQEFINILWDTYGVKIGQSAISKDLSELNIVEDKETGFYAYTNEDAKHNKARAQIGDLFIDADIEQLSGNMKAIVLVGTRSYLELISEKLEVLLDDQGVSVATILGLNGSLFVYFNVHDRDIVKRNLKLIQSHVQKKGQKERNS